MSDNPYAGWRGALRLLWKGLVLLPADVRRWLGWRRDLLLGRLDGRGCDCQFKNCGRESVATLSRAKRWRDDWEVCRWHYLIASVVRAVVWGVLLVAVVGGPLVVVVMFG